MSESEAASVVLQKAKKPTYEQIFPSTLTRPEKIDRLGKNRKSRNRWVKLVGGPTTCTQIESTQKQKIEKE